MLLPKRILFILCMLAGVPARPADASLLDMFDGRKACIEKHVATAPTIFLSGFYQQVCDIAVEPEPVMQTTILLAPILKPKECANYAPPGHYITPTDLEKCQVDRWALRQKWAKCRLEKQEPPDAQTDHAVDLVISGDDPSECGPYAEKIQLRSGTDGCLWPLCPFWSLNSSTGAVNSFAMHTKEGPDAFDESARLCADIRETVNAMIPLYEADPKGYKSGDSYKVLKQNLDNLPYPELPCPPDDGAAK